MGLAATIGLEIVFARLSGLVSLEAWGVATLFIAAVTALTGINIFALGVTFNYLLTLFYKQPIRQGLFGKQIFNPPLDYHFGWMGIVGFIAGFILGGVSLALGVQGWEIDRLWMYLLASAMLILIGIQLVVYWIILRVVDEVSQREILTQKDLEINLKPEAEVSLVEKNLGIA